MRTKKEHDEAGAFLIAEMERLKELVGSICFFGEIKPPAVEPQVQQGLVLLRHWAVLRIVIAGIAATMTRMGIPMKVAQEWHAVLLDFATQLDPIKLKEIMDQSPEGSAVVAALVQVTPAPAEAAPKKGVTH